VPTRERGKLRLLSLTGNGTARPWPSRWGDGFNARLRDELLSGELFRSMASEMMLRSMRQALKITSQPTNAEIKFSRSGLPRYTNAAGTLCLPSCGFSLDCF